MQNDTDKWMSLICNPHLSDPNAHVLKSLPSITYIPMAQKAKDRMTTISNPIQKGKSERHTADLILLSDWVPVMLSLGEGLWMFLGFARSSLWEGLSSLLLFLVFGSSLWEIFPFSIIFHNNILSRHWKLSPPRG